MSTRSPRLFTASSAALSLAALGALLVVQGAAFAAPVVAAGFAPDVAAVTFSTASGVTMTAPCFGDGVSGSRVQLVYAVASDQVDNYANLSTYFQDIAAAMDTDVSDSAAQTGGVRHIRFVTNPDCTVNVAHVTLSPTGDDTFNNTMAELKAQGFTSPSRKFLAITDADVYCGMALTVSDDTPYATNKANTSAGYARVDRSCWNNAIGHLSELHELWHTLGAVQPSAPHGTPGFHCLDESDALCYADTIGLKTVQVCAADNERLLDCNHDDYFSTNPVAGSYLATHWNTAWSSFLATDDLGTPAVSPVVAPTVTVTDTFTGSVSSKKTTVRFPVSVVQGSSSSALSFSSSAKTRTVPTLRLRVLDASGAVLLSGTGPSVLSLAGSLPTGSCTWEVYGTTSVSFSLAVTHLR